MVRIAQEAERVVSNLREATAQARQVLADVNEKVNGKDSQVQGLAADLRQTIVHARDAMSDLADNAEALKRNFFFRGYFNRRGYFDLDDLSPDAYRAGTLEGKTRKALRIWLDASYLFEKDPQGVEQLTDAGRLRLDSAMSEFLEFPSSAPLVVEGYADEPTGDARYLVSRHRASLVRAYLIAKFMLDSNRVGMIALGNQRPDGAGPPEGLPTRGVALALFVPR
jgi:phospholipid/cholesterol/gamma-HCH transport system substrate-binding protein